MSRTEFIACNMLGGRVRLNIGLSLFLCVGYFRFWVKQCFVEQTEEMLPLMSLQVVLCIAFPCGGCRMRTFVMQCSYLNVAVHTSERLVIKFAAYKKLKSTGVCVFYVQCQYCFRMTSDHMFFDAGFGWNEFLIVFAFTLRVDDNKFNTIFF